MKMLIVSVEYIAHQLELCVFMGMKNSKTKNVLPIITNYQLVNFMVYPFNARIRKEKNGR